MATRTRNLEQAQAGETVQVSAADRAMGASMIASGVGSLVLGIAIVLAEANPGFKAFATWNTGVGPLSGKTGLSVIAFVVSWVVLHTIFQRSPLTLMRSFVITLVLVALGLLLTFPPVFMSFGG